MKRRKRDRALPLSDPKRAPYARRALARKQREAERQALQQMPPDKCRAALERIDALTKLLGDA